MVDKVILYEPADGRQGNSIRAEPADGRQGNSI